MKQNGTQQLDDVDSDMEHDSSEPVAENDAFELTSFGHEVVTRLDLARSRDS